MQQRDAPVAEVMRREERDACRLARLRDGRSQRIGAASREQPRLGHAVLSRAEALLERRLRDMREGPQRALWWHATRRFRDGQRLVLDVPVRRGRRGAVPLLPLNCELVGGAVLSGSKRARVLVRRWPPEVRPELAAAGVALLTATMYGGSRERIVLPPAVAELAFGG